MNGTYFGDKGDRVSDSLVHGCELVTQFASKVECEWRIQLSSHQLVGHLVPPTLEAGIHKCAVPQAYTVNQKITARSLGVSRHHPPHSHGKLLHFIFLSFVHTAVERRLHDLLEGIQHANSLHDRHLCVEYTFRRGWLCVCAMAVERFTWFALQGPWTHSMSVRRIQHSKSI